MCAPPLEVTTVLTCQPLCPPAAKNWRSHGRWTQCRAGRLRAEELGWEAHCRSTRSKHIGTRKQNSFSCNVSPAASADWALVPAAEGKTYLLRGPHPLSQNSLQALTWETDSKSRTGPGIYLGEELLGHRVAAGSALVPVLKGLHKVMMSSAMCKNSSCFMRFPTPGRSVCLILDSLVTVKWHIIMSLLCIFLISEDVGPFPHA